MVVSMEIVQGNANAMLIIESNDEASQYLGQKWRYLRWNISTLKGGTGSNAQTMQASEFQLLVGSTKRNRPSGVTLSTNATKNGSGETIDKLIDGNTSTKRCPNQQSWTRPLYAQFDFGQKIDLTNITNWRWYNGNDTASYNIRNPNSGNIQVSNDGVNWKTISTYTTSESKSDTNYGLAYTGTITW